MTIDHARVSTSLLFQTFHPENSIWSLPSRVELTILHLEHSSDSAQRLLMTTHNFPPIILFSQNPLTNLAHQRSTRLSRCRTHVMRARSTRPSRSRMLITRVSWMRTHRAKSLPSEAIPRTHPHIFGCSCVLRKRPKLLSAKVACRRADAQKSSRDEVLVAVSDFISAHLGQPAARRPAARLRHRHGRGGDGGGASCGDVLCHFHHSDLSSR